MTCRGTIQAEISHGEVDKQRSKQRESISDRGASKHKDTGASPCLESSEEKRCCRVGAAGQAREERRGEPGSNHEPVVIPGSSTDRYSNRKLP